MKNFWFKNKFNRFDVYVTAPVVCFLASLSFQLSGATFILFLMFSVSLIIILCLISTYGEMDLE